MRREQRITADGVEVRGGADGAGPVIAGYAAVFDSMSEDLGGFREVIRRGAFKKTIKEADIRALWNHDPNYVLGRKSAGTLAIREDDHGLAFEVTPPDTQWARDLLTSIERRDVTQMSFAFSAIRDKWAKGDGAQTRELLEVRLFEVSPVTFPAYPATEANLRSLIARGFDPDELIDLTPDQITAVLAEARRFRSPEPEGIEPDHSGDQTSEPGRAHLEHEQRERLLALRRRPMNGSTR
jgi:HK97 family phage prohead protease